MIDGYIIFGVIMASFIALLTAFMVWEYYEIKRLEVK